jgi:hypothetical protein
MHGNDLLRGYLGYGVFEFMGTGVTGGVGLIERNS